jgi:hypothetical protein
MKAFSPDERLDILRAVDVERKWYSLDDKRICAVCDHIFTGRQIEIRHDGQGHYQLACPTPECTGDIRHWFLCEASPARYDSPPLPTTGEATFFVSEFD